MGKLLVTLQLLIALIRQLQLGGSVSSMICTKKLEFHPQLGRIEAACAAAFCTS
jgi:hypothetical protein